MVRYFIGFPTTGTGAFCWGKSWAGIGGQVEEGGRGGEWEGAKYFSRPTSRGPELAISRLQVFLEPLSLSLSPHLPPKHTLRVENLGGSVLLPNFCGICKIDSPLALSRTQAGFATVRALFSVFPTCCSLSWVPCRLELHPHPPPLLVSPWTRPHTAACQTQSNRVSSTRESRTLTLTGFSHLDSDQRRVPTPDRRSGEDVLLHTLLAPCLALLLLRRAQSQTLPFPTRRFPRSSFIFFPFCQP